MALIMVLSVLLTFVACGGESLATDVMDDIVPTPTTEKLEPAEQKNEQEEEPAPIQQPDFPETVIIDDKILGIKSITLNLLRFQSLGQTMGNFFGVM